MLSCFNTSCLEFTRCYYSEYVSCFILALITCTIIAVFTEQNSSMRKINLIITQKKSFFDSLYNILHTLYFEPITSNILFSNSFLCASLFRVFFSDILEQNVFAGCCLVDLISFIIQKISMLQYITEDVIGAKNNKSRYSTLSLFFASNDVIYVYYSTDARKNRIYLLIVQCFFVTVHVFLYHIFLDVWC